MAKIQIKTLTPVHVGSGNLLQYNTDYVTTKTSDNSFIRIVDDKKIASLLGERHLNDWLLSIARKESTKDFIKRYAPTARPADYSKRYLTCHVETITPNDTLKESIHDGMGLAYIPGSSLKGAIRTAVLVSLIDTISGKEDKINNGGRASAKRIEKELFGQDANSDCFRFIRVGDAYFPKGCEVAIRAININLRHKDDLKDTSKPQLIEAIGGCSESEFQLNICKEYADWACSKGYSIKSLPSEVGTLEGLFSIINKHTKSLLYDEIEYWAPRQENGVEEYVRSIQSILEKAENCNEHSCVLRLGYASGWRFITGAWTESLSNFDDFVVNASRPNNRKYTEYDFPKSRRIDEDINVFGFVKLDKIDE